MKKLLILLSCIFTLISCKKENKKDPTLITLEGEFIHISDAAVLKGTDFIYGVVLDEKAKELSEKVVSMKKSDYDMVPVVIKGVITANPKKEGWEQVVAVKEIIKILPVVEETIANEGNEVKLNVTE